MAKKLQHDRFKQKFIKAHTNETGGTLKIFGDTLNPSVPYKTLLLSTTDTAEWIVKEILEKYRMKNVDSRDYCLTQIIIPPRNKMNNKIIQETIVDDHECPMSLCLNYSPKNQGSVIFKIIKCPSDYVELRKKLRTQNTNSNGLKTLSAQDRIIKDQHPMFIEINQDGSDLLTPRVFKINPKMTFVGRDTKSTSGKQYFYIEGTGIDRDHCLIQNQNGIVTVIPRGEVLLNDKSMSTPFTLQHGGIVRFGKNQTFVFYDPQFVRKLQLMSEQNKQQIKEKSLVYSSLPLLPKNSVHNTNNLQSTAASSANVSMQKRKINVLPGLLEVPFETENQFLHAVFENYPLENVSFRLSPVYALYMVIRHRLSSFGSLTVPILRKQDLISLLYRIEDMFNKKIEECQGHGGFLAYWLANASEFLNFLRQDQDLSLISRNIQIRTMESIQSLFNHLNNCFQNELDKYLIALTNLRDDVKENANKTNTGESLELKSSKLSDTRWLKSDRNMYNYHQSTLNDLLSTLTSIIDLLRKCRVNVAITIQIFSQVFHYMNAWLFNRVVCCPDLRLCTYLWGEKLLGRLQSINDWAQEQGLDLTFDCHFIKSRQLCKLLLSSKCDIYDVQKLLSDSAFTINSIQTQQILNCYILGKNEPPISNGFREALLAVAHKQVDENLRREGLIIKLTEEPCLNIPFAFPNDGFACESLRGIPDKLIDFIEPMNRSSLCRLLTNSYSLGLWTEFVQAPTIGNDSRIKGKVETIVLNKKGHSIGLSIVSAKSESQQRQGIYIKGIVPGGAAEDDGRLECGDQILSVDRINLVDKTHEQTAELLKQSGPSVKLQILKHAAQQHGLSALFPKQSDFNNKFMRFHSASTSSLSSYPHSQAAHSHERLSPNFQQTSFRQRYSSTPPALQSRLKKVTFSNEQNIFQPRSITSLSLIQHDQANTSLSSKYQSNPNISISGPTFGNYENVNPTSDYMQTHSKSPSAVKSLKETPSEQNRNYQSKLSIPPKTLPKPVVTLIQRANSKNNVDFNGNLSQVHKTSSSDQLNSSITKAHNNEQEQAASSINTSPKDASTTRSKRIRELMSKLNRTEQEEKELKLNDEFNRRLHEFYSQIDQLNHKNNAPRSDKMDEFDEKLKRRLEQFEQEREVERTYANQMLTKREIDIEERLRQEREREIRADRDIQEFKLRRMSEEERAREAKKEQARLLKHIHLSNSRIREDQLSIIEDHEHLTFELNSDNSNSFLQQDSSIVDTREVYINSNLGAKYFQQRTDNKENNVTLR